MPHRMSKALFPIPYAKNTGYPLRLVFPADLRYNGFHTFLHPGKSPFVSAFLFRIFPIPPKEAFPCPHAKVKL